MRPLGFGWRKIVIVSLCLVTFDVFIAFVLFPAHKSRSVILSDLLFIEGALMFGAGALVASGASVLKIERWQSLYASPGGHIKYLREQRRKQFLSGMAMLIIGVVLICLSIGVHVFLTNI